MSHEPDNSCDPLIQNKTKENDVEYGQSQNYSKVITIEEAKDEPKMVPKGRGAGGPKTLQDMFTKIQTQHRQRFGQNSQQKTADEPKKTYEPGSDYT